MMYPETNFNYDNNNENKGNRKQRRQNKIQGLNKL